MKGVFIAAKPFALGVLGMAVMLACWHLWEDHAMLHADHQKLADVVGYLTQAAKQAPTK